MLVLEKPWWKLPFAQAAAAIVELETDYARTQTWRRARGRRLAGLYHGRALDTPFMRDQTFSWSTDPNNTSDVDADLDEIRLIRNKAFEYIETYVSKIGAEENPQPALMVTDGDWELKRKVTLNARLLEAEYDQRQGNFADLYALAHQGLRVATAATGSVAAKIYPWPEEDRVVVELHDTLDMFLDDTELTYNNPRTFGEVTWWPPQRLMQSYPHAKEKIRTALEPRKDRGGLVFTGGSSLTELVPVWEAWAVRVGQETGRHIACLRDGTKLVDEEWDETEPPFAFLHTSPALAGFWSTPMMELVYDEVLKVNEILSTVDFAHTHTPKQIHYVHEGSVDDLADIETVASVKIVRTKTPGYQPHVENPAPYNRIDLELLAEHERGIARTLGIDEMHSAARAEPGLPSAVAQREAASRFDDRAAAGHRAYIQWVAVDMARHILKAQRALYEQNHAFKRKWTGELFAKEIKAKDVVDLDYEALQVRIKPISEKKNTPEERVQYAQELAEQGAIPFEAYMAVLEHYDTPGETRVIKTQRRWVAWQIDEWLMAGEDEPVEYKSPRPWMRKSDALVQVIDALMEAELSDVPPERLQYFLDFVAELTAMMSAEVAPPAAAQAPLGFGQPVQGAAGMNVGAQGLVAPGLAGAVPGAAPAQAPAPMPGAAPTGAL
jgi:hypothetical protein